MQNNQIMNSQNTVALKVIFGILIVILSLLFISLFQSHFIYLLSGFLFIAGMVFLSSLYKHALIHGLILGLLLILISVILYMFDLTLFPWVTLISYPILYIGILFSVNKFYKTESHEQYSFMKALGIGALVCILASLLNSIFNVLLIHYIDPSLITKNLEITRQKMFEYNLSDEQLSLFMTQAEESLYSIKDSFISTIINLLYGLIFALSVAGLMYHSKMSLMKFLFSYKGRISLREYWLRGFMIFLAFNLLSFLIFSMWLIDKKIIYLIIGLLIYLAVLYSGLSVLVKRAHDRNRIGAFVLLYFIPIINIWPAIELAFLKGTDGANEYGEKP